MTKQFKWVMVAALLVGTLLMVIGCSTSNAVMQISFTTSPYSDLA